MALMNDLISAFSVSASKSSGNWNLSSAAGPLASRSATLPHSVLHVRVAHQSGKYRLVAVQRIAHRGQRALLISNCASFLASQ